MSRNVEGRACSDRELLALDAESQSRAMETWFRRHYEYPSARTPYDAGQCRYIWIWGGPCRCAEVLSDRFAEVVPEDVIQELAASLDRECREWAPRWDADGLDACLARDICAIPDCLPVCLEAIDAILTLSRAQMGTARPALCRLLYVQLVAALETYLCDAFMGMVMSHSPLLRRFVETHPPFAEESFRLCDVFTQHDAVRDKARAALYGFAWRNVERVRQLYRGVLGVCFPPEQADLLLAVRRRHDIQHRGRTGGLDGDAAELTPRDVAELAALVRGLALHVDEELQAISKRHARAECRARL